MRSIILLILVFTCLSLIGQDDNRMNEVEIKYQESFLEAYKLRITGKPKEAIKLLEDLLSKNSEEPAYYFELSKNYLLSDNLSKAIEYASNASLAAPNNIWYKIFLSDLYEKNRQLDLAIHIFEELIKIKPHEEEYWIKLSNLYKADANKLKNLELLQQMEGEFGKSEPLFQNLFDAFIDLDQLKQAEGIMLNLIEMKPYSINYKLALASLYKQNNEQQKSIELYKKILASDPNNAKASMALAQHFKDEKENNQYITSLNSIFENAEIPLDIKIKELIPYIQDFANTNDTSIAISLLNAANLLVKAHPNEAKVYALKGDILFHSAEYSKALEEYNQSISFSPNILSIVNQKLIILIYQKKYSDILNLTAKYLDIFPNQVSFYFYQALSYAWQGKYEDALSDLNQAKLVMGKNSPHATSIFTLTAICNFKINQNSGAEELMLKIKESMKVDPEQNNNFASLAADFNFQALNTMLAVNLALQNDVNNPFYLKTKAQLLLQAKKFNEAKIAIDLALENGGIKFPMIVELAGDIYALNQKIDLAMKFWKIAKDMGVESEILNQKFLQKAFIN